MGTHVYYIAVVEMIIIAKIYLLAAPILDLVLGFSFEPESILGHIAMITMYSYYMLDFLHYSYHL